MSRLDQLLTFLLSGPALAFIGAGVVAIVIAVRSDFLKWAFFGLAMYLASVAKYFDPYELAYGDPFSTPLEAVARNGRPIAILFLACLVFMFFLDSSKSYRSVSGIPRLMYPIHAIQALLLFKVSVSGEGVAFVLQALVIFFLIGFVTATVLNCWAEKGSAAQNFALALAVAGSVFGIVVEWHLLTNRSAVFLGPRLMGTTANPQHAAVLISLCLCGVIYLGTEFSKRKWWELLVIIALIMMLLHLLVLTGSRTGVVIASVGMLCLLRGRIGKGGGLLLACVGVLLFAFQEFGAADISSQLIRTEDTRTAVWESQWNAFLNYPAFGVPQVGERFGSAENSWLGMMALTGVPGLCCLFWFATSVYTTCVQLWRSRNLPGLESDINFCLAGIFAVLAGSFFEGYLLGVITFPVLFIAGLSVVCEHVLRRAESMQRVRDIQSRFSVS